MPGTTRINAANAILFIPNSSIRQSLFGFRQDQHTQSDGFRGGLVGVLRALGGLHVVADREVAVADAQLEALLAEDPLRAGVALRAGRLVDVRGRRARLHDLPLLHPARQLAEILHAVPQAAAE